MEEQRPYDQESGQQGQQEGDVRDPAEEKRAENPPDQQQGQDPAPSPGVTQAPGEPPQPGDGPGDREGADLDPEQRQQSDRPEEHQHAEVDDRVEEVSGDEEPPEFEPNPVEEDNDEGQND